MDDELPKYGMDTEHERICELKDAIKSAVVQIRREDEESREASAFLVCISRVFMAASIMLAVGCVTLFGLDVYSHVFGSPWFPASVMPWSAAYAASSAVGLIILIVIWAVDG